MYIINISTQQAFPLGISALRTHMYTLILHGENSTQSGLASQICVRLYRGAVPGPNQQLPRDRVTMPYQGQSRHTAQAHQKPFSWAQSPVLTVCFCSYWGSPIFQGVGILSQTELEDECHQSSALVSLSFAFCSWHLNPGFQACRQQNTFQALPFEVNFLFQAEFFHLLC